MRLKDALFKVGSGLHRGIVRATKGRLLGRAGGMPVIILTTTGRKSDERRSTMLTSPLHDGETMVVVASFGGDDRDPAWLLNLRDDPDVTVTTDGRERPMRARIADADEKADLWPRIIEAWPGYAGYQEKTERDIPVVVLEPRG
jgi:deazaflavin-dependent oxidoreductase (nitroreductase family)